MSIRKTPPNRQRLNFLKFLCAYGLRNFFDMAHAWRAGGEPPHTPPFCS
ncbi:MAG: hypothetical protein J6P38_01560 [Acetobacter sp.]|nr:hypothetical protein [Acetobacter sp.]MBO6035763.1 hypothetical protein [Acetobacter sp.]